MANANVIHVNKGNWKSEVLDSTTPVLVYPIPPATTVLRFKRTTLLPAFLTMVSSRSKSLIE